MRKITADNLGDEIERIMSQYCDEVRDKVKDGVHAATKAGVKAVKSASADKFGGTGKYASGWTSQMETGFNSAQGIIYNAKVPGLPHLLEHGHAQRGGGRTPGRVHIVPVADILESAFLKRFSTL